MIVVSGAAILNSKYRKNRSALISSILDYPGISIWFELLGKYKKFPIFRSTLPSVGIGVRYFSSFLVLWVYLLYPIESILRSATSLFVSTVSVLLASVTFGAFYGRIEKGLFLSIRYKIHHPTHHPRAGEGTIEKIFWASLLPVCSYGSILISEYAIGRLSNTATPKVFSVGSSVFVMSFIMLTTVYYFIAAGSLISIVAYSHLKETDSILTDIRSFLKNTFSLSFSDSDNTRWGSVYPDGVYEDLRSNSDN